MTGLLISVLVGQALFARAFGGLADEYGFSIIRTTDGGYALAGYTESFGAGQRDILVLKLNSSSGLVWARTYGGASSDNGWSIIQTTDGGYAVVGHTRSYGAGTNDILVLNLDFSGAVTWAKTYGKTTDEDYAYTIIQTTDGGYAVLRETTVSGAGYNFLVIKLDNAGTLQWTRTYGGTNTDAVWAVRSFVQTADGGFVVTGYTESFGAGIWDFLVLKISSAGVLQWARTFGGGEQGCSLLRHPDRGWRVCDNGIHIQFRRGQSGLPCPEAELLWRPCLGQDIRGDEHRYSLPHHPDSGWRSCGRGIHI